MSQNDIEIQHGKTSAIALVRFTFGVTQGSGLAQSGQLPGTQAAAPGRIHFRHFAQGSESAAGVAPARCVRSLSGLARRPAS